jgi:head-tail adaptor
VRIGPLRTRADVQRATTTKVRGENVVAWATVRSLSIDLRSLAGRERQGAAMQIVADATWRAFAHYAPSVDIRVKDRLVTSDRTFDVLAVFNVDDKRRMLQIELAETREAA